MEDNMIKEEVVEIAEEIANAGTGRGLKMFGLGAATVVVSGVAYKYAVKPLIKKIKNRKEAKAEEIAGYDDHEESGETVINLRDED